jgi:hypothetical protein
MGLKILDITILLLVFHQLLLVMLDLFILIFRLFLGVWFDYTPVEGMVKMGLRRALGEGCVIGVDNGDPASHESFQADRRRAFNGLCLAIIQATKTPGTIQVKASAPGMTPGSAVSKTR